MINNILDDETKLIPLDQKLAPEFLNLIMMNRAYLKQWLGWLDNIRSISDINLYIDAANREFSIRKCMRRWIHHKGKIIGIIHLSEVDWINKKASIGYWVSEEHRGKGFATKACRSVIVFAFEEWKLEKLEIRCATENLASQAIPTKLNFTNAGIELKSEWLYDHSVDHVKFILKAKDWKLD